MKNRRTRTPARPTVLPASVVRAIDRLTLLTFDELERLCDDPERNKSGQEVEAIITPHGSGYGVSACDGATCYTLVDENDQPVVFRSVEQALDRLSEVPYLPMVKIDLAEWGRVH